MVRKLIVPMVLMLGLSAQLFAETPGAGRNLTLVAEVKVTNDTDAPVVGYVHRIAAPLEDHLQQMVLAVRHDSVSSFERKPFEHAAGEYVEMQWDIPANSVSIRKVYFDLRVSPYRVHFNQGDRRGIPKQRETEEHYLQPSRFVESDANEIRRLARDIQHKYVSPEQQLRAAFQLPQDLIRYRHQANRGALYALTERQGDCTEYAALFVALARAMGYPARMTTDFLFSVQRDFRQPNHHAAEVFLGDRWIPVDPNLALEAKFGYGFGVGSDKKIVLNRNTVWVWSNLWPSGVKEQPGKLDVDMHWYIVDPEDKENV